MVPDTASRSSLNTVHAVSSEDVFAERWRQWQRQNAVTSRQDAIRARIAFTITFAGIGAWLGLQLLNLPFWP
jgi:hypothetical protein